MSKSNIERVEEQCAKVSNGLHPHPDVKGGEWAGWLANFKMPVIEDCPECGGRLVRKEGKRGAFMGCDRYPGCRFTKAASEEDRRPGAVDAEGLQWLADARPKVSVKAEGNCPKCGGQLVLREGKRGPFRGCSRYPACRYTEQI